MNAPYYWAKFNTNKINIKILPFPPPSACRQFI